MQGDYRGGSPWEADNEPPIDLENPLAVDTLVELSKGWKRSRLVEVFPGPDDLRARGPEGRFVHELIVAGTLVEIK
jgi:hypothetical protein